MFAYRRRHTKCVVLVISSGRSVMSDLRLQKKAHEVCSKIFLRVADLCYIFGYSTRHTKYVVSYLFGSLTYVTSSVTEQGTRSV